VNITFGDNLSDRRLVEKVLSGNASAFGEIITNTERLVAQIVFKMVNNAEDRKDLSQDIYLGAFRNLSQFRFQSKLSTWIGRIAYNTCLNYLEKKKFVLPGNLQIENNSGEGNHGITNNPGADYSGYIAELKLFEKERFEIVRAEIEKLPPIYRTLITLYHNEELTYEEIRQITTLPEGTVKNYLFRARKVLKDGLLRQYKKDEI
jgi:RNA polymerase sigma factor (sigma-70 family)